MDNGDRLHDFFYEKAYRATNTVLGQKFFGAVSPILAKFFPRDKSTRCAKEVLGEMGYNPDIFSNLSKTPVRIFQHNLKGLLSFSAHHNYNLAHKFFSPNMPASAIMPYRQKGSSGVDANYVIMGNLRADGYRSEISALSTLPERCLERLEGDGKLAKALTLAHEISHFDMEPTLSSNAARYVEIESYCDFMPFAAFHKAVDPEIFKVTFDEHLFARAIAPILTALHIENKEKVHDSIFGHATALMLKYPEILSEDNPGALVIEANQNAYEIISKHLDRESLEPAFMKAYRAAHGLLAEGAIDDDLTEKVVTLFVQGIEYFSPTMAAQALKNGASVNAYSSPLPKQDVSLDI